MSDFAVGNLFLLAAMLGGTAGQVLLKRTVSVLDRPIASVADLAMLPWARIWPSGLLALACVGIAFVCWLASLTRLDLSYAYTMACASAALVALLSVVFLGETISFRMAIGIALVVLGSVLLVPAR